MCIQLQAQRVAYLLHIYDHTCTTKINFHFILYT